MVVLPLALTVALAFACAAAVRTSFRLPPWTAPAVALVVALWPGSARILVGYEANLLLLVLVAAGLTALIHAGGRTPSLVLAGVMFLAAALTHAAIFAAFSAVTVLFVLLSGRAFRSDRRDGVPLLGTDAGAAAVTVIGAGAVGAGVLFGALGLRPSQTINTSQVSFLFRDRTIEELRRARPPASVPVGFLGAAWSWAMGGTRSARALLRFGAAWLAVGAAGILLSLRGNGIPGARFLLFALPVPVLAGLGVAGTAWLVAGRARWWSAGLGVAVVGLMASGFAWPGLQFVRYQFTPLRSSTMAEQRGAFAYLTAVPGSPPVVFVVNQPGPHGAFTPKLRFNVLRSFVPPDQMDRTFVYVGDYENLLAGRPTLIPPTQPWQVTYDTVSRDTWAQAGPALREGAVVLITRNDDVDGFGRAVASDPSREVATGLYALRGPILHVSTPPPGRPFGTAAAGLAVLGYLAALLALGWGPAGVALRDTGATALDRACLAPAVGAGSAVIGGLVLGGLRVDPVGPIGIAALLILAAVGFAWGRR